jgi:hypothetical protein
VDIALSIFGVIFASITAPVILMLFTSRQHRQDRAADWAREDAKELARKQAAEDVAAKAAKAASDLVKSQAAIARAAEATRLQAAEAARLLVRNNDRAAAAAEATNSKLDQLDLQTKRIHTLVNSDMTAARQSELDQTRAMTVVLRRVISLAQNTPGAEPDERDVQALEAASLRIADLEAILADRMQQMRIVEAQAAVAAQTGGPQIAGEEKPSPLDASAANLGTAAANLDDAAAHLDAAAASHHAAQEDLEVATAELTEQGPHKGQGAG